MTRRPLAPVAANGHGAAALEAATQGHPEPPWSRLSRLHTELARCYGDIAEHARIQVAAGSEQSDITSVRLLTVSNLAERLAVDAKTVRRWRREGRLPAAIEIGGVIRWEPAAVERWLKEQSG